MASLPCIDCIALAACKAYYIQQKIEKSEFASIVREEMEVKCCILRKWRQDRTGSFTETTDVFHKFFDPTYPLARQIP